MAFGLPPPASRSSIRRLSTFYEGSLASFRAREPLAREALLCAGSAAVLAAALAWLGPPGSDMAAHAYQRALFLEHGFTLWNNFWYAGRYSFVTYSVLYYPLAALLGIRLLAVATVTTAALAFAVVTGREWGPTARWSSRSFAIVWTGIVLSAAFPFALGVALALLALWALQERAQGPFVALALLTLAASPLAFALLTAIAAGVALAKRIELKRAVVLAGALAAMGAIELVLWRIFPDNGRYPFSGADLAAASAFSVLGATLVWRIERATSPPDDPAVLRACMRRRLSDSIGAWLEHHAPSVHRDSNRGARRVASLVAAVACLPAGGSTRGRLEREATRAERLPGSRE